MLDSPTARLMTLLLVAAAVALGAWFFLVRDDGDSASSAAPGEPVAASSADLVALQTELGTPVYWAGEPTEGQLELTRTSDDRAFVRYLPDGVDVGDPAPGFLTVGTYPLAGAYDLLKQAAKRDGAIVEDGSEGALVVANEAEPNSVYIGFRGEDYQVEVFDPDPARALELATSGAIEPVD
jgi:hypothetical protein